jgi:phenylpropionate dioxygenase-like ring-hydroxylating dioxygenase large terminal subunit
MFIHKHNLRHLLRPDQYVSEAQYRDELRHLFWPAWHLVATTHDLARPGDFLSFDLLEQPVLLRNMDGELRAFLNVCPHRHCQLTSAPRGRSEQLRCQYHGWEFKADGRTGRIPVAQAFRPFDRENACLKQFRVATCGALVFLSLAAAGPTLPEFLGPLYEPWLTSFDGLYRLAGRWEEVFPCNWKVVVENSLEAYHVPCVHLKTFGTQHVREEDCFHVLDERYSTFVRPAGLKGSLVRWLGGTARGIYEHIIVHPHLALARLDISNTATIAYPLSPTTSCFRMYLFTLRGDRGGLVAPLVTRLLRHLHVKVSKRVFREDATICAAVQRGLSASPYPGVIGTLEERIYAFQEYVSKRCHGVAVGPNGGGLREGLLVSE